VYVSPTKALVNQTVADVLARFNKNYTTGGTLCGYMTSDYRTNVLNCQVLITVPQCLEIIFLSPAHLDLTEKIRYVIFDEFHCINNSEEGTIWEHLFQYVHCPILALSATVGNPREIASWMSKLQPRKVHIVEHSERWCDLKKWAFYTTSSDPQEDWEGEIPETLTVNKLPSSLKKKNSLLPIHPASCLQDRSVLQFPADMKLTSEDLLILYETMFTVAGPTWKEASALHPDKFFMNLLFLSRQDLRKYEETLKR